MSFFWATLTVILAVVYLNQRQRLRRLRDERDVAQLKIRRLEEAREDSDQHTAVRQSALFDSMVEGVLVLSPKEKIEMANAAFRSTFGVSDDCIGQTMDYAVRSHHLHELCWAAKEKGSILKAEIALTTPENRILEANVVNLTHEGRYRGLILVFHELTELKRLENTRREFVANVSHELRTPLAMIKGFVETLMDGAKDDPTHCMKFLQTIDKHADRLNFLIEDILVISQIESGQLVMNPQSMSLNSVVNRVMEDLEQRGTDKKVKLVNALPRNLVLHIDGDRVQQVIFNLVDNAIKYGRHGGTVRVETPEYEAGQEMVEVAITDDGPGIPAESLDKIFERFFRVDKARSRDAGGTGLGLSIVKHIIQSHGGRVRVESQVDRGTTFFFTLPTRPKTKATSAVTGQ